MYRIQTDSNNLNKLKNLSNHRYIAAQVMNKVLRTIALDALVIISDRIQQRGKKADGSLGTYKDGYYKKERRQKGLNTSFVDLTFTGQMMNAFTMIVQAIDKVGIGWQNPTMEQRAEYNEQRYGKGTFELNQQEIADLQKLANKKTDELLKRYT